MERKSVVLNSMIIKAIFLNIADSYNFKKPLLKLGQKIKILLFIGTVNYNQIKVIFENGVHSAR